MLEKGRRELLDGPKENMRVWKQRARSTKNQQEKQGTGSEQMSQRGLYAAVRACVNGAGVYFVFHLCSRFGWQEVETNMLA